MALLASGDAPRRGAVVRALSPAVVLVGEFGIYAHVAGNYDAGPLDRRYAATWETLPAVSRWWYALTRSVGPAPPFAPGALAQTALVLLLATCAPSGGRGR